MTRVAILWHMHQPFYQDLLTGEHILPWVRLHALKDYWGMVALLREFPSVRLTFNLVPSLLVQLEAFANDEARDPHLTVGLKPAELLTEEERAFCVDNFFHAHRARMIDPYPRYAELLARRAGGNGSSALSGRSQSALFSVDDIRDLQVWHKLAWVDQFYLDSDPRVRGLVARGASFTEDDKLTLRSIELEILRRVVPEYREAAARGQVELSTSPFYHPILPLLCDTEVYLRTHPQSRMPRERFRHPDDAAEHLARAVALHERLFGHPPTGLWPSEGSVSDAMVPLVAAAGFSWMATDEEILARTTRRGFPRDAAGHVDRPDALYRPYRVDVLGQSVACAFRDHVLSDLIGFTYASWNPEDAAADFVGRLSAAGERYQASGGGGEPTIFVVLDGENAWEHYEAQGRPFLRALYRRLADTPDLRTVTMTEACAGPMETLPTIFPGSWINGDFYIWIGHADDHRAWDQLAAARRALDMPSPGLPAEAHARAREELLIAEGSDWFWWYGDDHSSEHDLEFDELFRRHVRNVYRALDLPIPEDLFVTNITTNPPLTAVDPPTGFIHPEIDGHVSSYFEWIGAGCVDTTSAGGAMHQVGSPGPGISLIEFGFNLDSLFVRVDTTPWVAELLASGLTLTLKFVTPAGFRVHVRQARSHAVDARLEIRDGAAWVPRDCQGIQAAAAAVLEVQIPFRCLGLTTHDAVALRVALSRDAMELEHHPRHRPIEFSVPDAEFGALNWTA